MSELRSFWERRQLNRDIVGKIVELQIYEDKAEKKVKGTFLIIFTDDLYLVGLQLIKLDLAQSEREFPVFNGEMTRGEMNFHSQKRLNFTEKGTITRQMRVINLDALGGIVDVDLQHLHIFKLDAPFTSKKQIDGNSFDDIMFAFFRNPVDDLSEEKLVREIYGQFNRN